MKPSTLRWGLALLLLVGLQLAAYAWGPPLPWRLRPQP